MIMSARGHFIKRLQFLQLARSYGIMSHEGDCVVSWTMLISAHARRGDIDSGFLTLSDMQRSQCRPNDYTYSSLLSVCDNSRGVQVHALALKTGFVDSWIYVANALVAMYWKNAAAEDARKLFDEMRYRNLVTYNSMLAYEQPHRAIALFVNMCHHDGFHYFDRTTLLSLLSSLSTCTGHDDEDKYGSFVGQLHCSGTKIGLTMDIGVKTALIKAYCVLRGDASACRDLFLETSSMDRDVVLWSGIMMAFVDKDPEQTLFLFNQMRGSHKLYPDCYAFSIVLKACANMVTEMNASAVHSLVIKQGFANVVELGNALIHAYARCGSVHNAEKVFYKMRRRDVVSWNSMLKAYAVHGMGETALDFFEQMDVAPDETTFVSLLSSCSHAGMVREGTTIFDSMHVKYGIAPQLDHYACVVDMLGRAGHLKEAAKIISQMPIEPDFVIWSALLAACRKYGKNELAYLASSKLEELDTENSLGYVQMSNIYCSTNSFDEGALVRKKMQSIGTRKDPGLSWTEVGRQVHEFASGGWRHPELHAIRANLEELLGKLKKMGYVPETSSVLYDVEEEHKEEQLYHHSEKLALVFCLMNGGDSNVVKIIKNIRICTDCHTFMKLASKLVEKLIIVRDANRFHHFKNGLCSCNDYW